jgi:mannose/fructose-specific phosphotransferase system component IIA
LIVPRKQTNFSRGLRFDEFLDTGIVINFIDGVNLALLVMLVSMSNDRNIVELVNDLMGSPRVFYQQQTFLFLQ